MKQFLFLLFILQSFIYSSQSYNRYNQNVDRFSKQESKYSQDKFSKPIVNAMSRDSFGNDMYNSRRYQKPSNNDYKRSDYDHFDQDENPQEMDSAFYSNDLNEDEIVKKEVIDFDYPSEDEEEREESNFNKRDLKEFSDQEIEQALSKLSGEELHTLDKLINEVETGENVRERRSNSNDSHDEKRCMDQFCKQFGSCFNNKRGKRSEQIDVNGNNKTVTPSTTTTTSTTTSTTTTTEKPEEIVKNEKEIASPAEKKTKRHAPFIKRYSNDLAAERRIQAKIDYLREKFKRDSYLKNIEKEVNAQKPKREIERNPYFNSMLGPNLYRNKRETSDETKYEETQNDERIKQLEESFPNPSATNGFRSDIPHIRVKRSP